MWSAKVFFFSFLMELAKVAIIHMRNSSNLATGHRGKFKNLTIFWQICWNLVSKYGNFRSFFPPNLTSFFTKKRFVWVNHTGFCFGNKVTKLWQRWQCWQSVVKKEKSKGGDVHIYILFCKHPFLILWSVGITTWIQPLCARSMWETICTFNELFGVRS